MFELLITDEYMKRIEMDPRLVVPFKNMIKRLSKYFEEHGYTDVRDYEKLIEKTMLMPPEGPGVEYTTGGGYIEHGCWKKKFSFEVTDEPSKEGNVGFYSGNRIGRTLLTEQDSERIVLDRTFMETATPEEIEKVLCHEFIHYLVMADAENGSHDTAISRGGFVNEALTEMLASEIYPETWQTYHPQVKMITFANILTQNEKNFRKFLGANIDFKGDSSEPTTWENFIKYCEIYHRKNPRPNYLTDPDYLKAQRFLIEHAVHYRMNSKDPMSIEDYLQLCSQITNLSPVPDLEWKEKYLGRVDKILLEKQLGIKHEDVEKLAPELLRLRELSAKKEENKDPRLFTQSFMGAEMQFKINEDGTCNVYFNGNLIRENHNGFTNLATPDFTIKMEDLRKGKITIENKRENTSIDIDVSQKKIQEREEEKRKIEAEYEEKLSFFKNPYLKEDSSILGLSQYKYTKVERVNLPTMKYQGETPEIVYIVHLEDGNTVILNSSGEEIPIIDDAQDRIVSKLIAKVGTEESYMYQMQEIGITKTSFIGQLGEDKKILIYEDENGDIQIARSDNYFAFIGQKETIHDSPSPSKKGSITNIDKYIEEKGTNLDEQALVEMVKGLDPKKRFEALGFIKGLMKRKEDKNHDTPN